MIPLSPREQQVVDLWASGMSYKAIGSELGITVNTINEHVRRARSKGNFKTRHALLCHLIQKRMLAEMSKEVTADVLRAISDAGQRVPSLWLNIR